MVFEIRDIATIIGGTISLASLYFALKRSDDKLSEKIGNLESYHKREMTTITDSMRAQKNEMSTKTDKLEAKIDAIQQQNAIISANLAELTGYIKAKQ
jgi:phage host-nuclease inhibitor protein Gam